MRRIWKNIIITITIAICLFGVWKTGGIIKNADPFLGNNFYFKLFQFFLYYILILLWVLIITYNIFWNKGQFKKRKLLFITSLLILTILSTYSYTIGTRSLNFYKMMKKPHRGWKGDVHQADPHLGFTSIPGSNGFEVFPYGDAIPMQYNSSGFRVPVDKPEEIKLKRPVFLFLGSSYTYGAATKAEETYPFLIENKTGGTSINAGINSYGLAQMYLLAEKLIPKYKPDFVVVQYSPWLAERNTQLYAPTYYGMLPAPYFVQYKNGVGVAAPPFLTKIPDVPAERYTDTPESISDFISFLFDAAIPLFMYDDFNRLLTNTKIQLGIAPRPYKNMEDIEYQIYNSIKQICKRSNSQMILLNLGDLIKTQSAFKYFGNDPEIIITNADLALWQNLPAMTLSYYEDAYYHWEYVDGTKQLKDTHPNPHAHQVIAAAILKHIESFRSRY